LRQRIPATLLVAVEAHSGPGQPRTAQPTVRGRTRLMAAPHVAASTSKPRSDRFRMARCTTP
jgi:hypothetical protein